MRLTKFLSSMRLICNACIMAAACILLATCSSSEPELGDITGRVTNDEDQPIQGADVEILGGGGATKTDAQGHYEFLSIGPGTYRVQVSKANYKTEEKSVTVEIGKAKALDFTLYPAKQKLSLSTKAVDFETEATTKIVTVTNAGMADLNWQLTEQVDWLTCTPTSGIIKPGKSESVTFRADRTKVLVGTWNDKVVFASDGGSEEVTVSITVPSISVRWEPAEMNFGDIETVMDLRLSGGSNVSYTLTPSNSWIIPSKNEGVFSKTENLRVSVRREGLAEGSYDGYLTLRVGAEQAYIPVRMNIRTREMPTVSMTQVKDVNDHAATFLGAVVSIGSSKVLHHGFCWSSNSQTPEISSADRCDFADLSQASNISYTAPNLTPGTTYWVRAYAENNEGVGYSQAMKFTTNELPQVPQLTTGSILDVQSKSVRVQGEIKKLGAKGGITQHGHVWSLYANPTIVDAHTTLGATEATGPFVSDISGLSPATTYHVRAYATNSVGTNYGDDITFTTLPDDMQLTTSAAADITYGSATLGGQVTEDGGNKVMERGVCVGTAANPKVDATHFISSSQSASFTVKATGLKESTTYHARAYVLTEGGKVYYGNDITFTTPAKPDGSSISGDAYEGEHNWDK